MLIEKLQDEKELKGNTTWLKSQDEELQDFKQKVEIGETTERKWTEALLFDKQQQEALGSHVKALTKEKKGKGECYDRFGIGEFEECISIVI